MTAAALELFRRRARADLLTFMRWAWWGGGPFVVGRHTRAICARLTRAVEDWERGISTQLVLTVPFRHGKSEIAKGLQAWFLGRCAAAQPSILEACYNAELAVDFSKQVRDIVRSEAFQSLFPGVLPKRGSDRANLWQLEGSQSKVRATGLVSGSSTGFGANLIIVDDYLRGYAESRSKVLKRAILNAFASDVYTRQNAPACIVLVIATQWADDDLIGSIERELGEGERFQGFEILRFPAHKPGDDGWGTLFPEFYPDDWYFRQRLALGPRMAAALLDCAPRPDEGGRFRPDTQVRRHTDLSAWPQGLREVRAWDLASSAKERDGADPDWTWGVRLGVTGNAREGWEMWVRHAARCRKEAPERDALIRSVARADGPGIRQYVEAFGAYKDAAASLRAALTGVSSVRPMRLTGDKTVKAAPMEPVFDACRVHLYVGDGGLDRETEHAWREDFAAFPDGPHDDAVDATALAFRALTDPGGSRMLL